MQRILDEFLEQLNDQDLMDECQQIDSWLHDSIFGVSNLDESQIRSIVASALGIACVQGEARDELLRGRLGGK